MLDSIFHDELESGKITRVEKQPLRVNAIGAVPKRGSLLLQPITDCSRPLHDSVNAYVCTKSFSFESVDDVLKISTPHCFHAIVDL